jgi:hypothetical protein
VKIPLRIIGLTVAAALAVPSLALARDYGFHYHHNNISSSSKDKAVAVGAILGLTLAGIAAANANKRNNVTANNAWGDAYSPSSDITCYRGSQQCFWRGSSPPSGPTANLATTRQEEATDENYI